MTALTVIGGAVALLLLVYLFHALIRAEALQ